MCRMQILLLPLNLTDFGPSFTPTTLTLIVGRKMRWQVLLTPWHFIKCWHLPNIGQKNVTKAQDGGVLGRAGRGVTRIKSVKTIRLLIFNCLPSPPMQIRASNEGYPKDPEDFTITAKAPTRASSWLKRHYANHSAHPLCPLRRYPNFSSTYCGVNVRLA